MRQTKSPFPLSLAALALLARRSSVVRGEPPAPRPDPKPLNTSRECARRVRQATRARLKAGCVLCGEWRHDLEALDAHEGYCRWDRDNAAAWLREQRASREGGAL
jgi:hypothetical protein